MGLIVNPLAGLGGPVGLKGTDGDDVVREALRRGAVPVAKEKVVEALVRLSATVPSLRVVTAGGAMGEDVAADAGFLPSVVHRPHAVPSTRDDTISAAAAMADHGVDLILFAGGDGTARDILAAVGDRVPVLGVPAGVKMHSAVFGTSAKNAGLLASSFDRDRARWSRGGTERARRAAGSPAPRRASVLPRRRRDTGALRRTPPPVRAASAPADPRHRRRGRRRRTPTRGVRCRPTAHSRAARR
ncbi:ATP-NAD kinase family protein [Acuticoccus yangtzensis]|uniref:ATP-NAD kinase family protein n=1 Tax=Acuticoccus yangtzensis TaxID=1443441 RepID=UPI003CCBEC80